MTVTLYMFYVADQHRAFLWSFEQRDDALAVKRAAGHLQDAPVAMGKLYTGPTGEDEMKFVQNVMLSDT